MTPPRPVSQSAAPETTDRPLHAPTGTTAFALAVASAIAFGLAAPFSKTILSSGALSTARLLQLRISGAALVLIAIAVIRRLRGRSVAHHWTARDVATVAVYGAIGFVAVQACYFTAIRRLPVGVALLFEYLSVVLVALFAAGVQRRRQPTAVWYGVGLVLVGLFVMTEPWRSAGLDVIGVIAGLGAAAGSATYFLLGEHASTRIPTFELVAASAAAASLMLALVLPPWSFPFDHLARSARLVDHDVAVWLLGSVVVVVGTVIAYMLGLKALDRLPAPIATVIGTLEVVVAATASWIGLGERLRANELAGGGIILAGVVLVGYRTRRAAPVSVPPDRGRS